ncbi:hypothetical protein D3C78_1626030 [compost metagenome]
MFQEFPKWKFKGEESVLCADAQEELDLGEGWFDSVYEARDAVSKAAEPSKEELTAIAESLGIKVDKRWGADRIAEAIAEAKANDAE